MRPYHITPSAEQDVIDITSYTLEKWGEKQALHYAGLLEKHFYEIGCMNAVVRSFSKLYPEIMVSRCEHHYIFFTHQNDQKPQIFAVLHEHMDFVTWLEKRLKL